MTRKKDDTIYVLVPIQFKKEELEYLKMRHREDKSGTRGISAFIRSLALKDREKWEREQSGFRKWLAERPGD